MDRVTKGGAITPKPIRYATPKGPTNQMREGPGLGGANLGCCGTQGRHTTTDGSSGSPGLHGTNKGVSGTQRG